jgi:nucleotide-binding universal stress UspA family protein
MKTLLAVTNMPNDSGRFINYIARMANDLDLNLHLITIINPASYSVNPGITGEVIHSVKGSLEDDKKDAQDALKKKINEIHREVSLNILIDFSVEIGITDEIINRFITKNNVELVALEDHYKGGIWTQEISSSHLALNINCPALIIPSGASYKGFMKVVYATNYQEADIKTLLELIILTKKFSPEIIALHVTESLDFKEKAISSGFRDMVVKETGYENITIHTLLENEESHLGEMVNKFALSQNANLIVLLKENLSFLQRVFKSSVTKKILEEAELPVLVYREDE